MRTILTLLSVALVLALPAAAGATTVAYIENGEVWVSSLDGASKARLAAPMVNADGVTEKWLAVAASDGGRIVAARNVPGRLSSFSWFKAWEPDGTSTVEGPLNAVGGWATYAYPLGFDITPDGQHMIYGYSNGGFCCPQTFGQGTYVRPVTGSPLPPINLSGQEDPTLFGTRVISHSGTKIYVQSPSTTYGTDFAFWVDVAGAGLELHRTDVAATGTLVAFEGELWDSGTKTVGKIGLLSIAGVDQPITTPAAVDCFLPAAGVATDVSLSQDARSVAWTDDQGLKVAGTPTTADDPCALTSAPVVIAAGGTSASIGGGDIAAFLPPPVVPVPVLPPARGETSNPVTATNPPAPTLTVPARVTAKSLKTGLSLKVGVAAAGKVTLSGTVSAKTVGKKGKPVVVATGSATAKAKGSVALRLKLNATGRKHAKKLKGARLTLTITQGGGTATKIVKLR